MFIILIIVVCALPIWRISVITVTNNNRYTDEEIIQAAQIANEHILNISFKKMKKKLLKLPYIKEVTVSYDFPGTIDITVIEKGPFGYVPFMGIYLCIDQEGRVIEQTNDTSEDLPIIKGLDFTQFKTGQVLPIINEDHLLCAVEIITYLRKYDYDKKVKMIDIYDLEQIHLYVDNLDVIIGNIKDFDDKLQWLMETHKTHDMGRLDLSQIPDGQVVLSPIT